MNQEQIEDIKRYFGVVAEGLRNDIRQVAEGHDVIRQEIREFREEVRSEFKEVRSLIKFRTRNWINESIRLNESCSR